MGPYSKSLQEKRRKNLERVMSDKRIGEDMKRIWKQHYNNLAVNEDEYLKRVRELYSNRYNKYVKDWL